VLMQKAAPIALLPVTKLSPAEAEALT